MMLTPVTGIKGPGVAAPDVCPHGKTIDTCTDLWCKSRYADLQTDTGRSEAAFWQNRKKHWISQGIDSVMAGELAWLNLAGRDAAADAAVAKELGLESTETPAQAKVADKSLRTRLGDLENLEGDGLTFSESADLPLGQGHHPECGAHWGGHRTEHCAVCHQTFSGESIGVAHRVGDFEDGNRRCRTSDELTALGLWIETNAYGTEVWHGSPNKRGIQKRHPRHKENTNGEED